MDTAVIAFIFFLLVMIIGYYIFLTWSLLRVCRKNSTNWIIIMAACYFIGLLGVIPLCFYWFGEEVEEHERETRKKGFNLGSHVVYVLNKQMLPAVALLAFFIHASFWVSSPAGVIAALPTIVAMLFVFSYSLYITTLVFTLLHLLQLVYLAKVGKTKKAIARILAIISEMSRWYLILLFVMEIYNTFAGWALYPNPGRLLLASFVISAIIGIIYDE